MHCNFSRRVSDHVDDTASLGKNLARGEPSSRSKGGRTKAAEAKSGGVTASVYASRLALKEPADSALIVLRAS
jgi:hypothetical protein